MNAYTVKVWREWTEVDSERAQAWLRDYFIHPLALLAVRCKYAGGTRLAEERR